MLNYYIILIHLYDQFPTTTDPRPFFVLWLSASKDLARRIKMPVEAEGGRESGGRRDCVGL